MNNYLVRCDRAPTPSTLSSQNWEEQLAINHLPPASDLNLRIENMSHALLQNVTSRAADFVRIASYVYAADQSISRGGKSDTYGRRWSRQITLIIPVADLPFWDQAEIKEYLTDVLNFLTGDNFTFCFTSLVSKDIQLLFDVQPRAILYRNPDSVVLFSGGADSLCATVDLTARQGKHPVLVSHQPAFRHRATQLQLIRSLKGRIGKWEFPHIGVWVHRRGSQAKESTQRSRSFLYATLGVVVASQLGVREVYLPDNGIVM